MSEYGSKSTDALNGALQHHCGRSAELMAVSEQREQHMLTGLRFILGTLSYVM